MQSICWNLWNFNDIEHPCSVQVIANLEKSLHHTYQQDSGIQSSFFDLRILIVSLIALSLHTSIRDLVALMHSLCSRYSAVIREREGRKEKTRIHWLNENSSCSEWSSFGGRFALFIQCSCCCNLRQRWLTLDAGVTASLSKHMSRTSQHQIDVLTGEWFHTVTGKVSYANFCFSSKAA